MVSNITRVHILGPPDDEFAEQLRQLVNESVCLSFGEAEQPLLPDAGKYNILVAGVPTRELITASPNLHTLIIPWAGLPAQTRKLMLEWPSIAIHNLHHNATATAEMATALMTASAKRLVLLDKSLRKNDWSHRYAPSGSLQLAGQTALILGYGAIGKLVACHCRGFQMDVVAIKKTISGDKADDVFSIESLDELLPKANVLFVCLPLTPDTKGLINAARLASLPDNAIVINIARGRVIDETALYNELKSGRIRAGLDVWYNYPPDEKTRPNTPPSSYPFHELDNVVMTPHCGGDGTGIEPLRAHDLAEMLNLATDGNPMPNRVDLEAGY